MVGGSGPTPLGRLISEVQAANRWSYADIAANARSAGQDLSKSHVEALRNKRLPSISAKAIEALAAGLRVPPDRVAQAALETMGYSLSSGGGATAHEAVAADPGLSEPVRRVLLAAIAAAHEEYGSGRSAARRGQVRRPASGGVAAERQKEAADDAAMDP
jgi:hypothetical protein